MSRCAIPSTCKSLHSLVADPKSYVSSSSGVILESTSALNTTLSVSASPSVIVPPLNVVVPVTVKFPPMLTFLATPRPPSIFNAPVVAEVDCVVSLISTSPVMSTLPVTDKISSTTTVPPAESSVRLPEAVSISPSFEPLAIKTSPI